MFADTRNIAVATAGFFAFLNLYSPQALLPALAREFGVGAAEISSIMTTSALAIALTAPFTGAAADVLGRKRIITAAMLAVVVPMAGAAFASDVPSLIVWRFLQGLLLPPIFAVTVAYIGDEWPRAEIPAAAGIYVTGSSLGGFCGRFIPGVLADLVGWRGAFLALAALTLAGAILIMRLLPREFRALAGHCRFGAADAPPPQDPAARCDLCDRFRHPVQLHRAVHICELSSGGAAFQLVLGDARDGVRHLPGRCRHLAHGGTPAGEARALVLHARRYGGVGRGLPAHARALDLRHRCRARPVRRLRHAVPDRRHQPCHDHRQGGTLVRRYVTSFYAGGSVGALLPGLAWNGGGWPACVAMAVAMLAIMALIAALAYTRARD